MIKKSERGERELKYLLPCVISPTSKTTKKKTTKRKKPVQRGENECI